MIYIDSVYCTFHMQLVSGRFNHLYQAVAETHIVFVITFRGGYISEQEHEDR